MVCLFYICEFNKTNNMNCHSQIITTIKLILTSILVLTLFSCKIRTDNNNEISLQKGLAGYWKLSEDISDRSKNKLEARAHGAVQFKTEDVNGQQITAASFNGQNSWLEVDTGNKTNPGNNDFSVSVWININETSDDVSGDIISQYDPALRRGFHLSLKTNYGTTGIANIQQLHFGTDDNFSSGWVDYGRPGNALFAFALTEFKGNLYAATCETGPDERGHVYRYSGNGKWSDCGLSDSSNSVMCFAIFNGELHAATGHYRVAGSSLAESKNTTPGGKVFRYISDNKWENCGNIEIEAIEAMIVYKGKLYASSMYSTGFYRYEGGNNWIKCEDPEKRTNSFAVYNGYLYAASYDCAHIYRYDGNKWSDCGQAGDEGVNTQCYGFAIYEGELYVSTWPSGRVYRFNGINEWEDTGRLGEELEVMGMLVHNGRLIAGTLPLAEVYSYEGDTVWLRLEQLDKTPDVKYRRAWTMAEHQGKAFCSTLPSGKIYGCEAGKSVMSAESISAGWHHVAAIKTAKKLKLFVDGKLTGETTIPDSMEFNQKISAPVKIGFGSNDYFYGNMRELRLYNRALNINEIKTLSNKKNIIN